ncbi:leukosialin [Leucoraja erinacea]|uniref:leukosialin n=1 Tax=Leucoraja erinaceus TaxID=7782 RepID=UPI0024546A9A|nr:leukosialin [Leucoraja erinacea]
MAVIRLTILALLVNGLIVNGLNGLNNTNFNLAEELNTTLNASSSTPMPLTSLTTMNMPNASGQTNDLPNTTSDLATTFPNSSQTVSNHSSEPSVSNSASPSTSPVTKVDSNTKSLTSTTVRKSTGKNSRKGQGTNLNASMIIACIIGGLLLFMVVAIIVILLVKRCSRKYNVQDTPWAGTCPGVISNDPEHPDEGGDAPAKRPSLTSFLSKKGKRDSLLDNYSMELQATEGVNNLASTESEEKALSADVKGDNEIVKEPPALTKTTSQEFPPLLEEHDIPDEADAQPPLPATDTETSKLPEGPSDADSKYFDMPPPPMDIVDLVNNSDLPPPL